MTDPANKSQILPAVSEDIAVPTESEHRRLIIRIFIICIGTAGSVFVIFGGIVAALFMAGHDSKKIVEVSTAIFQVISLTGAVGFFIPLGLASIVTLFIGIRMSRKSVVVLDKLDTEIESRLTRVDALFLTIEKFVAGMEKGELPPGIKHTIEDGKAFVKKELEALRDDIRGAKADADAELGKALDEGEAAGAAVRPTCRLCGEPMRPLTMDEAPTGEYACMNCT